MTATDPIHYGYAMGRIISYFTTPQNHLDDDKEHVSRDEFYKARSNQSLDAAELIDAILAGDNYNRLAGLQTEGRYNDRGVSLRDLYAAKRGRGYDNEELPQFDSLYDGLLRAGLKIARSDSGGAPPRSFCRLLGQRNCDPKSTDKVPEPVPLLFPTLEDVMWGGQPEVHGLAVAVVTHPFFNIYNAPNVPKLIGATEELERLRGIPPLDLAAIFVRAARAEAGREPRYSQNLAWHAFEIMKISDNLERIAQTGETVILFLNPGTAAGVKDYLNELFAQRPDVYSVTTEPAQGSLPEESRWRFRPALPDLAQVNLTGTYYESCGNDTNIFLNSIGVHVDYDAAYSGHYFVEFGSKCVESRFRRLYDEVMNNYSPTAPLATLTLERVDRYAQMVLACCGEQFNSPVSHHGFDILF